MKVTFVNGSPKRVNSTSGVIIDEVVSLLPKQTEIQKLHFYKPTIEISEIDKLKQSDAIVIVFPLYVDSIPSQLLSCLCKIEEYQKEAIGKPRMVYAIANCGFYEGKQNKIAIQIIENWASKSGYIFGDGIGIGGGGALAQLSNIPHGKGPKAQTDASLDCLANAIVSGEVIENQYTQLNFPWILYKLSAEFGWVQLARKNGLKRKDLSQKA